MTEAAREKNGVDNELAFLEIDQTEFFYEIYAFSNSTLRINVYNGNSRVIFCYFELKHGFPWMK